MHPPDQPQAKESAIEYREMDDAQFAENRLIALQNEIDLLTEQVPFGLHTVDSDGIYLSVNARELSWLGYTRQELVGKIIFTTLLTSSSRQRYSEYLSQLSRSGFFGDIEVTLIGKDGNATPVTLYAEKIPESQSSPLKYRCVMFSLAERKSQEEKLRVAATVFHSMEGMVVTDNKAVIINVNPAFTTITGYTAEEAIGKNPSILSSGKHDKAYFQGMWSDLDRFGFWEGDIFNRRKNGELYPEHLTITAVKNPNGVITNYVGTFGDISANRAAEEKIESLAFYDSLTGLPNRRLMLDRLGHAIESTARSGKTGAVLFLDLDDFKTVNDTLGHDTGDLLIREVAARLQTCVRKGDTIARIGGDEFVVILEEISDNLQYASAQTESIGRKMLNALNHPYQLGNHDIHNTASIGASLFSTGKHPSEEMLKQADIAMYQAKKSGRNILRFFDEQMQIDINARANLEAELRKAIQNREFRLFFQTQMDSENHCLGAEALIRWQHPLRGLVSPHQFIPLAEETGLILHIGQWVLEQACSRLKAWELSPTTRHLAISINISAKQFSQGQFVGQVQAAIDHYKIDPKRLKLELTESMLIENVEETIIKMAELKHTGIKFSLDDFGTGYSSLQYLKRLPMDQLKIDQSFVRNIDTDTSDQAIVRTVIAMAASLGLSVIAEGVETESQKKRLESMDCHHFQGYLFGKPMPIEQFEASLPSGQ